MTKGLSQPGREPDFAAYETDGTTVAVATTGATVMPELQAAESTPRPSRVAECGSLLTA